MIKEEKGKLGRKENRGRKKNSEKKEGTLE